MGALNGIPHNLVAFIFFRRQTSQYILHAPISAIKGDVRLEGPIWNLALHVVASDTRSDKIASRVRSSFHFRNNVITGTEVLPSILQVHLHVAVVTPSTLSVEEILPCNVVSQLAS